MKEHSFLLVGDSETGKTSTLKAISNLAFSNALLINNQINLLNMRLMVDDEQIPSTFWDCKSTIKNFNHYILTNHISTAIIFCNLQNTISCNNLEYWKNQINKHCPYTQIVIVGTYLASKFHDDISNKLIALQWCVKHDDLPFIEVNLEDKTSSENLYLTIVKDRQQRLIEYKRKCAPLK